MENNSTKPQTVQFNVGGKLFETSRCLIDKHEGTMIARLVSDTWQEDPTKPVFIDRNGDTFALVLDCLRYQSIILPSNLPKEMFLRDLDFYGIIPGPGTVKMQSEGWACQVVDRLQKLKELDAEKTKLELENDIDILANYCAGCRLKQKNPSKTFSVCIARNGDDKEKQLLWTTACRMNTADAVLSYTQKAMLQKSLSKFGLNVNDAKRDHAYNVILQISLL